MHAPSFCAPPLPIPLHLQSWFLEDESENAKVKLLLATASDFSAHGGILAITNWAGAKGEPLICHTCEVGEPAFQQKFKLQDF